MKSLQFDSVVIIIKAVTRIFFGGCHVELERRRREDRGAVGAEEVGSGEGVSPPQKIFAFFYFKMVSFCACLHGFLFGIFYRSELCHRQLLTIQTTCFAEQIDKVG